MKLKEVSELFWEIEKKYELLTFEIQGIKIWQSIRFSLFQEITVKLGILDQPHTIKDSFKDKVTALPNLLLNSVTRNPLSGKHKKIMIFEHPRKVKFNNNYIDIYTHYFIEGEVDQEEIEILASPHNLRHYPSSGFKRKYLDAMILYVSIARLFSRINFTSEEVAYLNSLDEVFFETFNIEMNFVNRIKRSLATFKLQYSFYQKLFQKRKPAHIYLVVSYGKSALISAAKDNGIETIEFQHGVITPYHMGYSFPNIDHEIEYFPDKILTFGEYWIGSTQYPKNAELEVYGFPHMRNRFAHYKNVVKRSKQILFISQGTIGKKLAKYAYNCALRMPNYDFIFKLHPGEYDRWKFSYEDLVQATMLNNFTVIDHNEKDLHSYMATSAYQVGVYSTAIFEGLIYNCKTILFNLPGIEHMQDLIKRGVALLVDNEDEFISAIDKSVFQSFDRSYFFKLE